MYKIVVNPLSTFETLSFDQHDCLDRKEFGESLSRLIVAAKSGAVIALDAPWGEGKTTFIRMWQHMIKERGAATVYLDAFELDHMEDPFVPLVGTLIEHIRKYNFGDKDVRDFNERIAGLINAAKIVAPHLLSVVAKAHLGLNIPPEDMGTFQEAFQRLVKNAPEELGKQLDQYEEESRSVAKFKKKLTELSELIGSCSEYPLVYMVDELDRCRPSFAIALLERIKHFLDVPGIVFIFVVNRKQLEESVKCIYGSGIDASGYLAKFVHIWCSLPKAHSGYHPLNPHYSKYVETLCRSFGISHDASFPAMAVRLAHLFSLTLREMERLFTSVMVVAIFEDERVTVPQL